MKVHPWAGDMILILLWEHVGKWLLKRKREVFLISFLVELHDEDINHLHNHLDVA